MPSTGVHGQASQVLLLGCVINFGWDIDTCQHVTFSDVFVFSLLALVQGLESIWRSDISKPKQKSSNLLHGFWVSPCLPSSFLRSPSPLIFLRNPSEKNIWWSKGIQLAGHEGNKPMSSRWPLSLVGAWWDPSSVPTFAASGGIAAVSPAFHLRATVLFFFFLIFSMTTVVYGEVLTLLCQVSSLLGHYSKDLWSFWSQIPGYLQRFFQEFWELQSHFPLPRGPASLLTSFCPWESNFLWGCFD